MTETALHTITCDISPLTHSQADGAHSMGHSRGVVCLFVGWLVAERPSNMRVHLRDGSAQTSLHAATLR